MASENDWAYFRAAMGNATTLTATYLQSRAAGVVAGYTPDNVADFYSQSDVGIREYANQQIANYENAPDNFAYFLVAMDNAAAITAVYVENLALATQHALTVQDIVDYYGSYLIGLLERENSQKPTSTKHKKPKP